MKQGFNLIELLIAMAIGSMLAIIITQSYSTMNQSVQIIDNIIDFDARIGIVTAQIKQDISGACIPPRVQQERMKKMEQKKPDQKENSIKPLSHIFYATENNKQFQLLTCITNNPLQLYWSSSIGSAKPRLVRVVYRLKPEPLNRVKPSFILVRQEATTLDFDLFAEGNEQKIREYELINNIKEMSCEYLTAVQKEEPKQDIQKKDAAPTAPQTSQPIEYKSSFSWNQEEQWQKDTGNEQLLLIPNIIVVAITLWDNQQKSTKSYQFPITIIPDVQQLPAVQKNKNEKPASTPGGTPPPNNNSSRGENK
ncbi:MAG TPA: prepilin-type N-terminal cleavage/methylation domain-containing protein [Candidatus Babeliales bacterium]|nr:prepilin-type N-terminal cleavage/methylation domain-containing protein [Candidatus Babeliales bacterium]